MSKIKKIIIDGKNLNTQNEVFNAIANEIATVFPDVNIEEVISGLKAREEISSTGFDNGIAIPHTKLDNLDEAVLTIVKGLDVDWKSIDGKNTEIAFAITVPNSEDNEHLQILGQLSRKLVDADFVNELKNANTEEAKELIEQVFVEDKKPKQEEAKEKSNEDVPFVIGVTACTTGIAHTYMAAENLEKAAKAKGYKVKIETRGQSGPENELTNEDIQNADFVILATDVNVPTARFNGKKVVQVPVKEGVHHPDKLLDEGKNAPIYKTDEKAEKKSEKVSVGKQMYQALMNGVTHMLPFTVAGGILIALRFVFGTEADIASGVEPIFYNLYLGNLFGNIGGVLFALMIPVLAGYIAVGIGNRAAFMPGLLAGFLAAPIGDVASLIPADAVSGFLGAIFGGFVAGYLAKYYATLVPKVPKSFRGSYQILFMPLLLAIIVGTIMILFAGPIGWLNTSLQEGLRSLQNISPLLLGAVLAGMMATDMGGPINKAAYVTGTLMVTTQPEIMAAVMIGGMVPPLAIALSTTIAKRFYDEDEIEAGKTNWILGLCFITEGAIPFAAADPKKVIPAMILGSATAGALSMFFQAAVKAPHGGIFVVPLMTNPLMFLLSLVIGTVVGGVALTYLKSKDKKVVNK